MQVPSMSETRRVTLVTTFHGMGKLGLLQLPVAPERVFLLNPGLQRGTGLWTSVDAPWLARLDRNALARSLDDIRRLSPTTVLGSHLPPACAMTERLLQGVVDAAEAPPFVGPDQQALETMFAKAQPLAA